MDKIYSQAQTKGDAFLMQSLLDMFKCTLETNSVLPVLSLKLPQLVCKKNESPNKEQSVLIETQKLGFNNSSSSLKSSSQCQSLPNNPSNILNLSQKDQELQHCFKEMNN